MKPRLRLVASLLLLLLLAPLPARAWSPPLDPPQPGPWPVIQSHEKWQDQARRRGVPVKLYRPDGAPGPWPVMLFSHGLGDNREAMTYIARHLAGHGYAAITLQHAGSDGDVGGNNLFSTFWALWQAGRDPENYRLRAGDLSFALNRLAVLNRGPGPWQGRLDLARAGVAGHSMGALSALIAAGQDFGGGGMLREPLFRAFVALSPPVPAEADPKVMYGPIALPGLHISGGQDEARLGTTPAARRRVPFDHIRRADQYLLWLRQGDHRTPLGRSVGPDRPADEARYHQLILMAVSAFADAYVRGEPAARAWLQGPALKKAVNGVADWEWRAARAQK
ncbi:MAG: hypothetical protein K9K66_17440 [Desulfarculaceae bacterium]|nr:hypothetical protein [Desulfarculaceae bacterium]MCF8072541.1 hypothetical protein [Desulfarculaceae bacterium]MCF8103444.1 hypothetical protein [Desulfarculaceae bacterium]MCF8117082.1 hypothetical protein [Desulfarculaceae bacterium]